MTVLEMLLTGFAIGLTGALAPGPMLFATIESSLKTGWTAGPKIFLGHAALEALISVLIIFGIGAVVNDSAIRAISLIGGFSLCAFGGLMLMNRGKASLDAEDSSTPAAPALAGIITSASNPYFWIWWMTTGSAFIVEGLKTGLIAAGFFVAGHWVADAAWYSLVSGSFSRSRKLISERLYRRIITACGMFLIVFGLLFISPTLRAAA